MTPQIGEPAPYICYACANGRHSDCQEEACECSHRAQSSRPTAPESETPETDAMYGPQAEQLEPDDAGAALARSLERRLAASQAMNSIPNAENLGAKILEFRRQLSLAQTEINEHMRVVEELRAALVECQEWRNGPNGVRWYIDREAQAQSRIAELEKDAARLTWLEDHHTLHTQVDILYIVDGYQVTLMHEDGFTTLSPAYEGHDLRAAIDAALKSRA